MIFSPIFALHARLPARSWGGLGLLMVLSLTALGLAACSPALDWRDVRPAGTPLQLLMPCKPSSHQRSVPLAGQATQLSMQVCTADEQTWALAWADAADPARVMLLAQALMAAARSNVAAGEPQELPLQVPGATPNPASQMLRFEGRKPDGLPVQMQVAVFVKGTQVFQATGLGGRVSAEAAESFFGSLRFAP